MNGRDRRNRARCAIGVERLDERVSLTAFGMGGFGASTFGYGGFGGLGSSSPASLYSAPAFTPTNTFSYTPAYSFSYTPTSFSANTFANPYSFSYGGYSNPFATNTFSYNTGNFGFQAPSYSYTAAATPSFTSGYGFGGVQYGAANPFATTGSNFGATNPLSGPTFASGNTRFVVF